MCPGTLGLSESTAGALIQALICRQAEAFVNVPLVSGRGVLAGGCVPALASAHLVTWPGGMLPTRSHGHQLCRAPRRKPKSCGAPGGHQQDHNTLEKTLPCPPQCTEQDALGSAKDDPAALHRSPVSLASCPGTLWEHRVPFPQGNTVLVGTWLSQGQPELTEAGGSGRAGRGAAGGR